MALPPSPISGDPGAVPPPGAGADMPMDDAGGADEVIATICKTADGQFKLYAGDEPEEGADMPAGGAGEALGGEPAAPEAQTFDNPGALLRALMPLLDEGTKGAEDGFAAGFKGGSDDAAGAGPPMGG